MREAGGPVVYALNMEMYDTPANVSAVRCYAQRMLSPYRGLMQVVATAGGEAVSIDGVEWGLYLDDHDLQAADGGETEDCQVMDIRYGHWSARDGLRRAPLLSTMNLAAIHQAGSQLVAALEQLAHRVPFPLADQFELWLLDASTDQPLALLDSRCRMPASVPGEAPGFRVSLRCRRHFHSPALERHGVTGHGEWLEAHVNAGSGGRAQWFQRDRWGNGRGLDCIPPAPVLEGRVLDAGAFPLLLLQEQWPDPLLNEAVADYHAWQAPWLLLLPSLPDGLRASLERAAARQAVLVAAQHVLYPRVVDRHTVQAALVEAAMRRAHGPHPEPEPEPMFPGAGRYN